jgi:hypothetical protein
MQMVGKVRGIIRNGLILFLLLVVSAPMARADYAVLRSGSRIHVTGYEAAGDRMRLYVSGGTLELPIENVVSVEPEDTFPGNSALPLNHGPYSNADSRRCPKTRRR